jgi:hypothetical protein
VYAVVFAGRVKVDVIRKGRGWRPLIGLA